MKSAFEKLPIWFPLSINHFDRPAIKSIRKKKNGIIMCDFYLWLILQSTQSEGRLRLSKRYPYNAKNLAEITDYCDLVIEEAMKLFQDHDLITIDDEGTIIVHEFIELQKIIEKSKSESTRNSNNLDDEESNYSPSYKVSEDDD